MLPQEIFYTDCWTDTMIATSGDGIYRIKII